MLTPGVPGSGTTAVLLALLISLNITPGPLMFTQNADIAWGVIAALLIGNFLLLVLNMPLVPIILGLLLGPEMENNLRHAMDISSGDWTILWDSGLAIGLWVFAGLGLILPYIMGPLLRRRMASETKTVSEGD